MNKHHWHNLSASEVFNILKTSASGLSLAEVALRRKEFGLNILPDKKKLGRFFIFVNQFKSPLIYILIIATVVSFLFGKQLDAVVIFAAVVVNTVVGFFQENKAQNSLYQLRQAVIVKTRVKRENVEHELEASELVPGDIIVLEAGDKVPADARILVAKNIQINESALTGEAWEIEKINRVLDKNIVLADRVNMLYMGSVMTAGRAEAIVVQTGLNTEIGKIAELLQSVADEKTPLQQRMEKLSKQIGFVVLFIVLFLIIFGLFLHYGFLEMFEIGIAVAVSAIPEGMVVALTVVLAIGMQNILKKKGLVRQLVAAEALGSTTVICTDKTGTLTTGEMQVTEIITHDFNFNTIDGISVAEAKEGLEDILSVLKIGVLCNEAVVEHEDEQLSKIKIFGNMTERALLLAGLNFGLNKQVLQKDYPEIDILPFDSDKKYMATLHKYDNNKIIFIKGAPEMILARANFYMSHGKKKPMTIKQKNGLLEKFEKLSRQGLRILAIANKDVSKDTMHIQEADVNEINFIGFIGMKDPIRENVKQMIDLCKQAGLKVVMITGDYKLTAQTIAKEIGLQTDKDNIITGQELSELSEKDFYKRVSNIEVYARVTPLDKLRIIKAWQYSGEVVAMTGDGVNDAPALKKADIGVAMGGGTEVAKGASDLVILDNSFSTIVAAIEQGRVIYDNIRKVILYLLSNSMAEVLIIIFALLFGWPLPLLATQILWINIVNDGMPAMALTLDPEDLRVMKEKPRSIHESILDGQNKLLIFLISVISAMATLVVFYYFWKTTGQIDLARTTAFSALAVSTLMYIFSCRSLRQSIFESIKIKNWYLVGGVVISFLLQLIAIYTPFFQEAFKTVPLGVVEWLAVFMQGFFIIATVELVKGVYMFIRKKKS
jgi:Ca2+-transporting ATPase